MNNPLAAKLLLYRLFNTGIGIFLLKLFSPFVYAKNLKNKNNPKNKKFIIAVTVDTESGYVAKNERRVWQVEKPCAFTGFYNGIENWRKLLNKHKIKGTFFLSTQCFDAKKSELRKIASQLKNLGKENHEIGLHLHPNSDFALQEHLKNNFKYTSAKFYDYNTILSMLNGSKYLIEKNLGKNIKNKITSFRWGNWGLDATGVKALSDSGFKIDSSATPGIKGHLTDIMYYDWSRVNHHYPWKLSMDNYQNIKGGNSSVLEIPIATFNFLGLTLRADPIYSQLLLSTFDYYYKNADRNNFIFVVMSHSSEGTYEDGKSTKVIRQMDCFIRHAKRYKDVKFVALKEGAISLKLL